MSDLIERLRTEDTKEHHGRRLICGCAPLRHEAADEIERLEAAIRWALGESPDGLPEFPVVTEAPFYRWRTTLRKLAALKEQDDE